MAVKIPAEGAAGCRACMSGRALLYSRIVRLSPLPLVVRILQAPVCPGGGTAVLHHLQPSDQLLQRPDTTQQVKER